MAEPEPIPVPEPAGELVPPPRKPPTAIGLLEPSRPSSDRPAYARITRMTRVARLMFGALLVLLGAGLGLVSPVGLAVGVVAIVGGVRVVARVTRAA